jgi:hypothetical protein
MLGEHPFVEQLFPLHKTHRAGFACSTRLVENLNHADFLQRFLDP